MQLHKQYAKHFLKSIISINFEHHPEHKKQPSWSFNVR